MLKAQAGNSAAYEEFLHKLYPYILSIVKQKLGSIVDQEDLTQECLLGIHKNLASYHPSKPLKPWISAIIRYKMADYFRLLYKRKDQTSWNGHNSVTNQVENTNYALRGSSEQTTDVEQLASLSLKIKVLKSLPIKLQQALYLTQLKGLSYSEAAKQEGISEPALRKRVSRAYKELRKIVSKDEEINFND